MEGQILTFAQTTLPNIVSYIRNSWISFRYTNSPIANGILLQIAIILLLVWAYKAFPNSKFSTLLSYITEKMYEFFEEIMGEEEKAGIKTYIVVLFFIIVISNLLGLFIDFVKLPFPQLEVLFAIPTANINFTAALATIGVVIMLILQNRHLGGILKQLHEYIPITGNNILSIERGTDESTSVLSTTNYHKSVWYYHFTVHWILRYRMTLCQNHITSSETGWEYDIWTDSIGHVGRSIGLSNPMIV